MAGFRLSSPLPPPAPATSPKAGLATVLLEPPGRLGPRHVREGRLAAFDVSHLRFQRKQLRAKAIKPEHPGFLQGRQMVGKHKLRVPNVPSDDPGQKLGLPGRHHKSINTVTDYIPAAAGSNYRETVSHGFELGDCKPVGESR